METDEEPIPTTGESDAPEMWPEEDLSVYVAPQAPPLGPYDEPILRLEPTLSLVGWPLGILLFTDFTLYIRVQAPPHHAMIGMDRFMLVSLAVLTILIVLAPFYFSPSYFAELYADRLVVRRGSKEWATPLEDIVNVDLLPCPVGGARDLVLLRVLASLGAFSRFSSLSPVARFASDAPKDSRSSFLHAYNVRTSFDTAFWIPPFVGHEEFATAVLQQREHVLSHRPPVVRGTVHENPSAEV